MKRKQALQPKIKIIDVDRCSNGKTIDDPTSGYDINNSVKGFIIYD